MRAINPVSRPTQPTRRGFTLVETAISGIVVAGITAVAALVRLEFNAPEVEG